MKRAVILDRDGVINDNRRFANKPQDLVLYPTTAPAIHLLNEAGFLVCVATNQGGVGLGYMKASDLDAVHAEMVRRLERQDAHIDAIRACIHEPRAGCACRKPQPGMLLNLQEELGFELSSSYMVGDRDTDVMAGKAAGTQTVFIGSRTSDNAGADACVPNLLEAARWIISNAHQAQTT